MGAFSTVVASRHVENERGTLRTYVRLYTITYNPTIINRATGTDFTAEPSDINKMLISLLVGWARSKEGRFFAASIKHAVTLDDYLDLASGSGDSYPTLWAHLKALGVSITARLVEVFPVMEWTNDWYEIADEVLGKTK